MLDFEKLSGIAWGIFLLLQTNAVLAQDAELGFNIKSPKVDYDTLYIEAYPELITGRAYLSEKYTNVSFQGNGDEDILVQYEPNTFLNLGVGATVNSFTLNIAIGFKFLNPDIGQGDTRYLDLQSHIYSRKFVVDVFAQFYKGMYLENTKEIQPSFEDEFYVRPDIYEQILGFSAQYIFNNQKYTYRAALLQNERQLKSAGSFLLGAEAYYGLVFGDSALVPSFALDRGLNDMAGVDRIAFFHFAPSAGYAHTFVVARKFFLMLSLTLSVGVGINNTRLPDQPLEQEINPEAGGSGRFALGYNTRDWYLGISAVNNAITSTNTERSQTSNFGIGNVRINYVKRFQVGPKLRKYTDRIP